MSKTTVKTRSSISEILLRNFMRYVAPKIKNKSLELAVIQGVDQARTVLGIQKTQAFHSGGAFGMPGGSSYGGYSSGGAAWPGGLSGDGHTRTINHVRMRRNARNAYHDSPQARAIVDRFADTVADVGLVLECSPRAEVLGITPEQGSEWGKRVDALYDLWMRDKTAHRSETLTGYQAQHLYQKFIQRDNDIFIRLYYSTDRNLQNPLQWEFIDPEQINGQGFTSTNGPYMDNIPDGIERDNRGRETSYRVSVWEGKVFKPVTIKRIGPKSKRIFMLHGFSPEYAGQRRGYSRIGFALQGLQNITDFSAAQIKKAINQSSIVAMVENNQIDPSDVLEGAFGTGPAATQFGSKPNPSSDAQCVTDASLANPSCTFLPEANLEVGSTMIINGKRGDSLKPFAQNAPSDSFDKFVDAFMYYLSAAAGIPLEVVLMRFSNNYSASRGTLILFWRVVMMWRDEWAADAGNPMFEMWLSGEIGAGRIKAPGWQDPILRAAWLHCTWRGAPVPDIDPSKTAKARRENLSMGLTSPDREAHDLNGSDADTNREQLKRAYGETVPPPWSNGNNNSDGTANTDKLATAVADEIEMRKED